MNDRLTVAVLFGGMSGEHEVSVVSARSVIQALDPQKYNILPVYINKSGQWLLTGDVNKLSEGDPEVFLPAEPQSNGLLPTHPGEKLPKAKIDVVFPVLHGTFGEDGTVQGLLELANLPFVGSGVLGSALGMDKAVQKRLFKDEGLPVVNFKIFYRKDINPGLVSVLENEFTYPLFIKPANLGSSVGISKVHNKAELLPALEEAVRYDRKIVIEQGVNNVREIEVAVLGNDHPEASVPGEVIPAHEFYDYEAKYLADSAIKIPAPLAQDQVAQLQKLSLQAFQVLDLKGMARVDFLLDSVSGKIYLSEVNTIPGFTDKSMFPKLWEETGLSYPKLLDKLITLALEDFQEKQKIIHNYNSKLLKA